ncbi:PepSY-associated TM helix domain-containing protein [Jiulongibacter sp. NS-SX5]|uniref:PepSY-associated TM helix domain-containing protein n=1 Tax=Jiulongibacter sp. NS-SX5 TaxID=3463854 RepID=UPI00405981D4
MTFKKLVGQIHLWLGLTTGLVVFIISITGCLYAFESEIQDAIEKFRFSEVEDRPVLPPSVFVEKAKEVLPGKHLHAINYPETGRSVEAIFYSFDPEYYDVIYLNPYTAELLHVKDMEANFFHWVLDGHYYLWLPPQIGQPITAYSTLIFLVMLVSGIILWWPKNKSAAKQRFKFKWKSTTKWKRKNYDLHNIPGFYASWLLLVLAVTGIVFGIQWFREAYYGAIGGEKSVMYAEPLSAIKGKPQDYKTTNAMDEIWHRVLEEEPEAISIEVHVPESDSSSLAVNTNTLSDKYWTLNYRYFDQYTLEELEVDHVYGKLEDATAADKLMRMNYDIHIGAIWGFPGKILAFLLSLTAASLPITGFLIWWGRKKKK